MTKTLRLHNMTWIANTTKTGGAQAELLADVKPEPAVYLVLVVKEGRRYGVIEELPKLVQFLAKNRHAFEIIPTDRRRKFYLEFDDVREDRGETDEARAAIFQELQAKAVADAERICGAGIAVLSGGWGAYGEGKIKYSLHLVRPDRFFPDHAAMVVMPAVAASVGADAGVYSRNQAFKFPGQSKLGSERIQHLIGGEFSQHIITAAFEDGATELKLEIPMPLAMAPGGKMQRAAREKQAAKGPASGGLGPWKDQDTPIPDTWAVTAPPLETLQLIRHGTERPHRIPRSIRYMVMSWAAYKGIPLHAFLEWAFQGKEDTDERRARYTKEWREVTEKRRVSDYKIVNLVLKVLYPGVCFDNQKARIYKQRHDLATTRIVRGDPVQSTLAQAWAGTMGKKPMYLGARDFGSERAALFHVRMGGGKTHSIHEILKRGGRCLLLTHRQTLALDIYANCKNDTELKHYGIDFPTKAKKATMGSAKQLICQLESIHHLQGAKPYDVVMIDESELLLMQAAAETFKDEESLRNMWDSLTYHIQNAKYVRCYDGFMGRKTMAFLKGLGIDDVAVVRMSNHASSNGRTMHYMPKPRGRQQKEYIEDWAYSIGKQVAAGKNVMVFYPFIQERRSWIGMREVLQIICKVGGIDMGKETVMHYGGMDQNHKEAILSNVNVNWRKRVVITNSAVTAGVDFTELHFDRLYACVSGFQNPREIVQWLSRARNIRENQVFVTFISTDLKPEPIADRLGDCPVYKNLIADINTELDNNGPTVLECYALDAGYVVRRMRRQEMQESVVAIAEDLDVKKDLGMLYENIEDVGWESAELLKRKVAAQVASSAELLALDKFYFNMSFRQGVAKECIAELWDEGYTTPVARVANYKRPESGLRREMPGLCRQIDEVLSRAEHAELADLLSEVFCEPLDKKTSEAIMQRYKKHYEDCTSDNKLINMVMSEACGVPAWTFVKGSNRWQANKKLSMASTIFAVVGDPRRSHQ